MTPLSLSRFGMQPEWFVIAADGQVLSVLPGDTDGTAFALVRGTEASGVAGAGDIALGTSYRLGGWISYTCHLASPRRFAVRAGALLLEGKAAEEILGGAMRSALSTALAEAAKEPGEPSEQRIAAALESAACKAMIDLGWTPDRCSLAKIHLIRRDQP